MKIKGIGKILDLYFNMEGTNQFTKPEQRHIMREK